jgi:hypothetical protein
MTLLRLSKAAHDTYLASLPEVGDLLCRDAAVWAIDERDFPADDADAARLRFVLRYAILAPSGHNGQPWQFHIDGDLLSVRADRSRALPASTRMTGNC